MSRLCPEKLWVFDTCNKTPLDYDIKEQKGKILSECYKSQNKLQGGLNGIVKKSVNMNEELLKILNMSKQDFEMLQDGTWDLNYSDGSEIQASIDNVEKTINIVKNNE